METKTTADSISVISGGSELLDRVRPLWEELREHHAQLSSLWREGLLAAQFEDRKRGLLEKAAPDGLRVVLASSQDRAVAYCICTTASDGQGEVDSIYVTADSRRRGLGRALMAQAMTWLRDRAAEPIVVDVLDGNEAAQRLYESFGFHPRTIRLRHMAK